MVNRRLHLALLFCLATGMSLPAHALAADIERVEFRLTTWKSLHFDDAAQATEYLKTFKKIGCECKQEEHGDHIDVRYTCPKWKSLTLKTHAEAHKWEDFLKKAGFETKHEH